MSLIYSILVALNLIAPNASMSDAKAAYMANPGAVQQVAGPANAQGIPIPDGSEVN